MSKITPLESIGLDGQPPWAIDGVVSGVTLLWGESGVGKTFVALSMASSIASGRPWIGHRVHPGPIVYIAGEGGEAAVGLRFRTALATWGLDVGDEHYQQNINPVYIVTPGIDLVPGVGELAELIPIDCRPRLIVVDTLSRCFVGDENKQEDMGRFVRSLDILRHHFGSDVLVVHHANRQHEIRGSSVLYGAADVCWHLTKNDDHGLALTPNKLRERSPEGHINLRTKSIPIVGPFGPIYNELGAQQTTLIIKPTEDDLLIVKRVNSVGLNLLVKGTPITYSQWEAACDMERRQFEMALSFILTYPGRWGIMRAKDIGTFMLADPLVEYEWKV